MKDNVPASDEWDVQAAIGPILFRIAIDSAFFVSNESPDCPRHNHAAYEFYFITKGKGTVYTDDSQVEILPGSYLIIHPGIYHEMKTSSLDPIERLNFRFDFDVSSNSSAPYPEEEIRSFLYALSNIRCFYSNHLHKIGSLLSEIQAELIHEEIGFYPKVQYLFSILFIHVIREITSMDMRGLKKPHKIGREDRISIIDKFFDSNYNYKATSKDLCRLLHISSSQLNRILKDKYHMTFKQKHMETQIERIKFMLSHTNLSIGEIAEEIGYTSEDNFIAFFKKVVKVSPKVFRGQGRSS